MALARLHPYVMGVVARGTPCRGVYAIVQVAIDEEPLGHIPLSSGQWQTHSTLGRVEEGRHKVTICFVNDAGRKSLREARNLKVDKVLIAFDENPSATVTFLTEPSSTAAIRRGRGTIVVDQLRWDSVEPRNGRKANRYACSLLAALGGAFAPFRPVTTIECEAMSPEPGLQHFRNNGDCAALACNGPVQTPLQVATTGRYEIELVAGGTHAAGVYPVVEVRVDGKEVARVPLAAGTWRAYPFEVELTEGKHELALAFVNDANINGQDRNLRLDKVRIEKR